MADVQISGLPYKLPASTDKIPVQSAAGATSRLLYSDTQQYASIYEPGTPLVFAIPGGGSAGWTTAVVGPYQGVIPNVLAATDRLLITLPGVYRLTLKASIRAPTVGGATGDYTFDVQVNGALTKIPLSCCVTLAATARFATVVVDDLETLASGDYVDLLISGPTANLEICRMALTAELVGAP